VRTLLIILWRLIKFLPLLIVSPFLMLVVIAAIAATDLLEKLRPKRPLPPDQSCLNHAASVVIPNWNGRDLLEKYLPSVVEALAGHPDNEIIVVDNGSTDGSAEMMREKFPSVRVLALDRNLGFGGGSNAGFQAAKNGIVILLNSDMRVQPDFLAPLLAGFTDAQVFAVACQIYFSDPQKLREETGLTQGWWENGGLRVRHRDDQAIEDLYPCFYGGGGSCAFDRRKFLELGGFDELLRPFYLEDTDLGYLAWKRGWKVLYQPRSVVYHEHRGTIGKRFSPAHRPGSQKEFHPLLLEKHSRMAALVVPLLFHLCRRRAERLLRRFAGTEQSSGPMAGVSPTAWSAPVTRSRPRAFRHHRHGSFPQAAGRLLPRSLSSNRRGAGEVERPVCFALSDLPSGPRRRRVHVSNRARADAALFPQSCDPARPLP
jgi:GT2 family glycosyltransferase